MVVTFFSDESSSQIEASIDGVTTRRRDLP